MPGFDPHVVIKELAEAEWIRKSLPDFAGAPLGSVGTQSMYVPFVLLRGACPYTEYGVEGHRVTNLAPSLDPCGGRNWVPEPDVRVACWEIFENHPAIIRQMMERPDLYGEYEMKEAVLRAAQAWLKEQHAKGLEQA